MEATRATNANITPVYILTAAAVNTTVTTAMPVHCFIFADYGMRRILVLQTLKRSGGKSAGSHPAASSGLEA